MSGSRRCVRVLALLAAGVLALGAGAPDPPAPDDRVLDELLDPRAAPDLPGTTYREFTTTLPDPRGGPVRGDVVEVDLTSPAVRIDLLTPPAVAAVATVPDLAGRAGAPRAHQRARTGRRRRPRGGPGRARRLRGPGRRRRRLRRRLGRWSAADVTRTSPS